jgi:hypothetical protein
LFRWIEIQLEWFTRYHFRDEKAIKLELDSLKRRIPRGDGQELREEYTRLFDLLRLPHSPHNYNRAIRMLQLLACSPAPQTIDCLVDAMSARDKK